MTVMAKSIFFYRCCRHLLALINHLQLGPSPTPPFLKKRHHRHLLALIVILKCASIAKLPPPPPPLPPLAPPLLPLRYNTRRHLCDLLALIESFKLSLGSSHRPRPPPPLSLPLFPLSTTLTVNSVTCLP